MAAAFLRRDGKFLMMKRAMTRELSPGKWAAVGGHVEPGEMATPEAACRREILEEAGLAESDLRDLRLQCVILRLFRDIEIRQQFIYFGETNTESVRQSDEGELFWIPEDRVMDLDMPQTTRLILGRYLAGGFDRNLLYLGVSKAGRGDDTVEWTTIEDFDLPPRGLFLA